MVKTRSQTERITIKEEEEEHKNTRLLHNIKNTVKRTHKITKEKATKGKSNSLPLREVKVEEETDRKFSSKALSKHKKKPRVTENQIKQLIDYVENRNMTMIAASRKVNIHRTTGYKYYHQYKKYPKRDLSVTARSNLPYTEQKIETLIKTIVDDEMSLREASRATNMPLSDVKFYYERYSKDPNHKTPVQLSQVNKRNRTCTQDQITRLIHYIVNDNMSVQSASIKANMCSFTGRKYYTQYMNDPNHKIPVPRKISTGFCKPCTQEQVNELIGYIINDSMSIPAASAKVNISTNIARRYYRRYMNDPDHKIPIVYKSSERTEKRFTQKDIKNLIDHIVNDNMSVAAASVKVNMSSGVATRYYHRYLNDPKHRIPSPGNDYNKRYTKDQIKEFIGYIVDDKLSVKAASIKLNMSEATATKYYKRYLDSMVAIANKK
ncbi:hypothetical protein K501DRAFT_332740 [Backusella circina FSU 941]|nr:hypothetical protein K501DRAFT_332740 [Backusella circina FSU 941]